MAAKPSKKLSVVIDGNTSTSLDDTASEMEVSTSELARRAISVGLWFLQKTHAGDQLLIQPKGGDTPVPVEIINR